MKIYILKKWKEMKEEVILKWKFFLLQYKKTCNMKTAYIRSTCPPTPPFLFNKYFE